MLPTNLRRPLIMLLLWAFACPAPGEVVVHWDMTGREGLPANVRSYFTGGMEGGVSFDANRETPLGAGALAMAVIEPSPTATATHGQVWLESATGLVPGDYRMTVMCRASAPVEVGFGVIILDAPYTQVSSPGSRRLTVPTEWEEVEWDLAVRRGHETEPLRIPLMLLGSARAPCTVWIASISLNLLATPEEEAPAMSLPEGRARPLVGAIRWDAWHTPWSRVQEGADDGPVRAMERSLGPGRYHWRLPFFAQVVGPDEVRIDGYTQEIIDREIGYAQAGGVDYWAFLLYDPGSPMSQGLTLYLSSARKRDVAFCAIAGGGTFGEAGAFQRGVERILGLMAEPSYLKVAGDRPLLYVFRVTEGWIGAWGGPENTRRLFDGLRDSARAAGHGDPYIVAMNDNPAQGSAAAEVIGADAITGYAVPGGGGLDGTPYADLAWRARQFWDDCAATGKAVVPLAMAGWDRRPRVEHPVPWERWQEPNVGLNRYYGTPTPAELADHISAAMRWAATDVERCPAQAMLTYAWNEHDEGGWLCPTLGADGAPDTSRLDALADMLRDRWGE